MADGPMTVYPGENSQGQRINDYQDFDGEILARAAALTCASSSVDIGRVQGNSVVWAVQCKPPQLNLHRSSEQHGNVASSLRQLLLSSCTNSPEPRLCGLSPPPACRLLAAGARHHAGAR